MPSRNRWGKTGLQALSHLLIVDHALTLHYNPQVKFNEYIASRYDIIRSTTTSPSPMDVSADA